ncbi:hypothetical protein RF55_9706 [Lasius niger]|uniref:Reverse transcriptase domain-containing protein n=1 Tax=Lasius niger TaxID=67767 RepID=A0A0J7KJX5_LASNI|nr:hypothetical protein RF55_9706 [Lasius niger]
MGRQWGRRDSERGMEEWRGIIVPIADMDERLRKGGWGGVRLRERKIYTLAYADDIAVLAEDEEGLKGMMGKLEGYLDGKGLELNTGKSNVMRCRKGGGRWKMCWRWKGKVIEEVKEFRYLGYTVSGGVGMEGKRGNGKAARQISEMDVGGGEEDSRVYGKGGNAKGYVERESRVKGLKI